MPGLRSWSPRVAWRNAAASAGSAAPPKPRRAGLAEPAKRAITHSRLSGCGPVPFLRHRRSVPRSPRSALTGAALIPNLRPDRRAGRTCRCSIRRTAARLRPARSMPQLDQLVKYRARRAAPPARRAHDIRCGLAVRSGLDAQRMVGDPPSQSRPDWSGRSAAGRGPVRRRSAPRRGTARPRPRCGRARPGSRANSEPSASRRSTEAKSLTSGSRPIGEPR